VVEVAVSSLTRDLIDQPPIYAQARVPVYGSLTCIRVVSSPTPRRLLDRCMQVDTLAPGCELVRAELAIKISLPGLFAAAALWPSRTRSGDRRSR
jgi:hypothetical protein